MTTHGSHKNIGRLLLAFLLSANAYAVTDISTTPLATYVAATSTDVKPNLMYILDDSGSMDWNYMPDWANDNSPPEYLSKNNAFNGVAYNPAVTYSPPVSSYTQTGTTYNAIYYPSMDGTSTTNGADSTTKPNWKAVPNDGFGIQSTASSNLVGNAYSWTIVAGEYCDAAHMRTCQVGSSSTFIYPAKLRWCNSTALTTCQAVWSSTYNKWRTPSPRTSTITVSGTSSTSVSSITVGGVEILSALAAASTTSSTVATNIRDAINACTLSITGNCGISGYSATVSGSVVTISAPGSTSSTPVVTKGNSGTMTLTATAFAQGAVAGENLRTNIVSTTNSYPYPGSSTKASTRTDCAGTTCTYNEEMTNYANWWAYYHTRMQMMKSASGRAFSALSDRFRVGYMSINNNTGSDFQNISDFNLTQRNAWNTKLTHAQPNNSTPLRAALSDAGRLYGGKLNGATFQGSTVIDPLQYSCQQNYTILSTDGFWNSGAGYQLDGSTAVGNQDGLMARPYADGATANTQKRTSTLQQRTGTLQSSTSSLQQWTTQLQTQTSTLQGTLSKVLMQCANTTGVCGTAPATGIANANWSIVTSGSCTVAANMQCAIVSGLSGTSAVVSSCNTAASITPPTPTNTISAYMSENSHKMALGLSATSPDATRCYQLGGTGASTAWFCRGSGTNNPAAPASSSSVTDSTGTTWYLVNNVSGNTGCTTNLTAFGSGYSNSYGACPGGGSYTLNNADSNGKIYSSCAYSAWSAAAGVASCTPVSQSGTPNQTSVVTARQCNTVATTAKTNVASCTTTTPDASGFAAACGYTAWTTPANAASCTDVAQSTSSPYTVGTATACSSTGWSAWTNASSCTATASSQCQYTAWSSWSNVSSCSAVAQSTAPSYTVGTAAECQSTSSGGTSDTLADVAAYYYNTDLRSPTAIAGQTTGTCTGPIIAPATTASDLCANNVPPNGLDVATTQHMTTFTLGLGAPGSMLFSPTYWTDKSGDFYDVWQGNSANTSTGACAWQANGTQCNWPTPASDSVNNIDDLWHAAINGRGDYFSATSPDTLASSLSGMLAKIVNTPLPGTAAAAASSNPNISSTDNYVFSSSYVSVDWYGELIRQQIDATTGTLTAPQWSAMTMLDCAMAPAWTASHTYSAGDTFTHSSSCYVVATAYSSGTTFNATVGSVSNVDAANSTLITMAALPAAPTVYTKGASGLIPFNWASLSAAQKAYFSTPYISGLSQFCASGASCLSSGDQVLAQGANLVAFLGGSRTNEGTYYRQRKHVLGDIVSSEARYVQTPLFSYNDSGYSAFKTLKASRSGTVYVAANDGMLHAFDAATGAERWGYIPSMVLPNIYALADKNYSAVGMHQFFVDNSPEVGDICPSAPSSTCSDTQWKTILVGGLNRGGKGYYALDITDPANPVALWEFTDATLGYTYGNPRIVKLSDGTWVVLVTSGYNNADGVGRLYVLNASTGALISTIGSGGIISTTGSATPGTATNPSGLARISAHVPHPATDNTVQQVYGGDLNGDLWRFDVNNNIGTAGYDAQLLISFKDASGNAQPITAKPVVTSVNSVPVVYVGTGRYLGTTDVGSTTSQSFYAVVDRLGSTTSGALYGDPRTASNGFVQQILTSTTCPANSSFCTPGQISRSIANPAAVNLSSGNGWFIDFLTAGERSSTDPGLGLGSLIFTTITPQTTSASACGAASADASSSFVYALNYLTGASVAGAAGVGGVSLGNGIATRPVLVEMPNGTVKALIRVSGAGSSIPNSTAGGSGTGAATGTSDSTVVITPPINTTNTGQTRRISWRELITE